MTATASQRWRASSGPLRRALLWPLVCAGIFHCAEPTPAHLAADASGATAPARHGAQQMPDGTCCPPGAFFATETSTCEAVGPPECAAGVFNAAEKCQPRWCWDWRDDAGTPCTAWSLGCQTVGRACTSLELDEKLGSGRTCPAGSFPVSDTPGDCAPAGHFEGSGVPQTWDGVLATLPAVPPLQASIPPGVPQLTAVPAIEDTFFCRDSADSAAHFCTPAELETCRRGPAGDFPDANICVYVGVPRPIVCPPGFVVDDTAVVADGQLPPCLADPADCGTDDYGDAALQDAKEVVFVNALSGDDGNPGTRQAPLKTIGKGLAKVGGGITTVAVAAGTYPESVGITKPVNLLGRCAAMVTVAGPPSDYVLKASGKAQQSTILVRGMRLSGKGNGVAIIDGPKVRLESILIIGVSTVGLIVEGSKAALEGQAIVVASTLPVPVSKDFGRGMNVSDGATVDLQDVRLTANRDAGLFIDGAGTALSATRLLIDGTLAQQSDKKYGRGINVAKGALVTLQEVRLSANRDVGLHAGGAGTVLVASRVLIDGTLPQASDKKGGRGLNVENAAHATVQEVRVTGSRDLGVFVGDPGSTLDAYRVLVDGTLSRQSDSLFGRGAGVHKGAKMTLQEARLTGNRNVGLFVHGAGTTLTASRVLVDSTLSEELSQDSGWGVGIEDAAHVTLQDTRLSINREVGMFVGGAGTALSATRLLVDGTLSTESDKGFGRGVNVQFGAQVALRDTRLSANRESGLTVASTSTVVEASDLVVEGTLPQESDLEFGRGVSVLAGAQLTLYDARLSGNRGLGLGLSGTGTAVRATRLLVDGTLPQESDKKSGRGVGVQEGAMLQVTAGRLLGNLDTGIYVASSVLELVGTTVDATSPRQSDQTGGVGLWLIDSGTATILASAFRSNRAVALAIDHATAKVQSLVVLATDWGQYQDVNKDEDLGSAVTLADGILLNASPDSTFDNCLLATNRRTGILAEASPGLMVKRTLVNGGDGLFGLVLQHTLDAILQYNGIFGATSQNIATDAGLSLPKPPEPVAAVPAMQPALP